jgi:hypothetical protein
MAWVKTGVVVPSPPPVPWAVSHAMVPFVERDDDGLWLYFSSRDGEGRSVTGRARFDPDAVPRSLRCERRPVLGPGSLGAFDDSGAMGSCIVERGGIKYLYYIGWSRGVSVPFYTFIGCAVSTDGGTTFARASNAPIVGRDRHDAFLTTSPWVLVEDGLWRMWYASGTGWQSTGGRPRHSYHIRYAESDDGILWRRDGHVCIDYGDDDEYAIARPCVVRTNDGYQMWYARRGTSYRIGFATSDDGVVWTRKDAEVGIDVSGDGWDSEMIEYPCIFGQDGMRFMLYNGNGYGATGIGMAVREGQ